MAEKPTLAIVGTGVAGLGAAYFLHPRFEITFFEQNSYAGGHSNTVCLTEKNGHAVSVDTGFMVYNEPTYPNLSRLFRELGVETKPTDMSFSVQHRPTGLEYNGTSLNKLFAQRRNLLNPRFWRLLTKINRFNAEAIAALEDQRFATMTLGEYVAARGYGEDFLHRYIIPMGGAVWSTPPRLMLEFPAQTLLHFFYNHGFLGLHTQHPWRTPAGGSRCYVAKLRALWGENVRLDTPVEKVFRNEGGGATVQTRTGEQHRFDHVILATHADQALRILSDARPLETELLREFKYQPNTTTLHTDPKFMPKTRAAWASWNVRIDPGPDGEELPSTHYWMNSLQACSPNEDYFVSLNTHDEIAPERVLRKIDYEHPLFSLGAIRAQERLPQLNRQEPRQAVYFCGSYFKYGFHEDAFSSGLECARAVTGEPLWQ